MTRADIWTIIYIWIGIVLAYGTINWINVLLPVVVKRIAGGAENRSHKAVPSEAVADEFSRADRQSGPDIFVMDDADPENIHRVGVQ